MGLYCWGWLLQSTLEGLHRTTLWFKHQICCLNWEPDIWLLVLSIDFSQVLKVIALNTLVAFILKITKCHIKDADVFLTSVIHEEQHCDDWKFSQPKWLQWQPHYMGWTDWTAGFAFTLFICTAGKHHLLDRQMDVCLFGGEITYLSCIRSYLLRICIAINITHKASKYQKRMNFTPLYVVQAGLQLETLVVFAVLQDLLKYY